MIATRGRKRCTDFNPPEEYRSQQIQDEEEWDGSIGCSFGPHSKPSRPQTLEDELQYLLWDMGIRCDVRLLKKQNEQGGNYISAQLEGDVREQLIARPIVLEWISTRKTQIRRIINHD